MGLIAFAIGLDLSPLFEMLVHNAPLRGAHRVELDRAVVCKRLLRGAVGACDQQLSALLAIPGRIEHDPLALTHPQEGGLIAEQLQGIDRLASFSNQQAIALIVTLDHEFNLLVVLMNLNLTLEVKLRKNALYELLRPL